MFTEVKANIGYLWLSRADKSNAMGSAFFAQLPRKISELDENADVRVIIVASNSRHFSTGLDLMELQDLLTGGDTGDPARALATIEQLQKATSSLATCRKPVIAAVNGHCIGGGLDLASYADLRLCSADAVFSLRETKLAMIADLGSLQRLPSIISRGHLAEDISKLLHDAESVVDSVLPQVLDDVANDERKSKRGLFSRWRKS